jgi:hypothetical protein
VYVARSSEKSRLSADDKRPSGSDDQRMVKGTLIAIAAALVAVAIVAGTALVARGGGDPARTGPVNAVPNYVPAQAPTAAVTNPVLLPVPPRPAKHQSPAGGSDEQDGDPTGSDVGGGNADPAGSDVGGRRNGDPTGSDTPGTGND